MRDRRLELFGLLALTLTGGLVWLTRHPGAPIVRRAEGWPIVGSAATAFRARWDPPAPPPQPPAEPPIVEYHYILESDGPTPGRPAAPQRSAGLDPSTANGDASILANGSGLAAGSGLTPVLPVPALAADPALLDRASRLFAAGATEHRLGGYRLLTDTSDLDRIARWSAVVEAAEPAWLERYGVEPIGAPAETVVLFVRRSALRELQQIEPKLGALDTNGFTLNGVVAVAVEGLDEAELDATFQHELAHLLTRRSLGPALPAWLAEGLSEEFGLAPFAAGGFDFESVRGTMTRDGNRFELRGGLAALDRLRGRAEQGALFSLPELTRVSELDFSAGEAGLERYSAAFAWVRFLLAEPPRAERFRRFLSSVAKGSEPTLERLSAELGAPLEELRAPLHAWVVAQSERILRDAGVPRQRGAEPLRELPPSALPTNDSSSRQLELPSA